MVILQSGVVFTPKLLGLWEDLDDRPIPYNTWQDALYNLWTENITKITYLFSSITSKIFLKALGAMPGKF